MSSAVTPRHLRRESLSLTAKKSTNWAARSRDLQSRKKELRLSDSSDDDLEVPRAMRHQTPPALRTMPHSEGRPVQVETDMGELAAWNAIMSLREDGDEIRPEDLCRRPEESIADMNPWEAPSVIHNKRCLRPVTPEHSAGTPDEAEPASIDDDDGPEQSPWEEPVVIHAKRCVRPITPEIGLANTAVNGDEFGRVRSAEPMDSPWSAPVVIHAKRCVRPVTPELGPSNDMSEIELLRLTSLEPWEEPVVIHAKRCVRPITPEIDLAVNGDEFGRVPSAEPMDSPWSAPVVIHAKRCVRPVTPELGPADVLANEHEVMEPLGDAGELQGVQWLVATGQENPVSSGIAEKLLSVVETGNAQTPSLGGNRNIPSHRGRPRVAREVRMLLENTDSDEEPVPISLSVRGVNPVVERVMKGEDSDDDLIGRRGRTGRAASAHRTPVVGTAVPAQEITYSQVSNKGAINNLHVVELRMSKLLLRSTVGSDDEDLPPSSPKQVSPAASKSEERERAMQAFRSARKIAVMEQKAMQLANCSDSDDDTHHLPKDVGQLQRHAIEREVDGRMSGKRKQKSPAASVTGSVLDEAEQEWVLVLEEEKAEPRPPPTSFLTPLRGKRPVPSRRTGLDSPTVTL
jgi:hypothetical protein